MIELDKIYNEDCLQGLKHLPDNSVDCCVTSPPYYALRDYGVDGQIGLEETPQQYIDRLTEVFMEVYRVMKPTGTLWLNIGDSYCGTGDKGDKKDPKNAKGRNGQSVSKTKDVEGCKHKDLIGIPWMLAFSLRNAGWYLRQDIIWAKPNAMPEPVKDRCTKSHEYIFLLSKSDKYFFDYEKIQEAATTMENRPAGVVRNREYGYESKDNLHPEAYLKSSHPFGGKKYGSNDDEQFRTKSGKPYIYTGKRNKRDVWTVNTHPDLNAHFATYPEELIRPCVLAGCPMGGVILDPFMGSGTTARVARRWGRHYIGFELNPEYIKIIEKKVQVAVDLFAE